MSYNQRMAATVTYMSITTALKSIEKSLAEDKPFIELAFRMEKGKPVEYNHGTKYANITFIIDGVKIAPRFFYVGSIIYWRGIADPKDAKDKRNEYSSLRTRIDFSVDDQTVVINRFFRLVDEELKKRIALLDAKYTKNKKINPLVVTHQPEDSDKEFKQANFRMSFDTFPADYYLLERRGKPQTELLDAERVKSVDQRGFPNDWEPLCEILETDPMTHNPTLYGSPACLDNLHKVIPKKTTFEYVRFHFDSVALTKEAISVSAKMDKGVVRRPRNAVQTDAVSDEDMKMMELLYGKNVQALTNTSVDSNANSNAITHTGSRSDPGSSSKGDASPEGNTSPNSDAPDDGYVPYDPATDTTNDLLNQLDKSGEILDL